MSLITWVGINHYVEDAHLEDFYASLHPGDVVRMVPEPENFWDKKAIAVYYNFLMRGHISRQETDPVHELVNNGQELIGRITDDIDDEMNEVKISIDGVAAERQCEVDYPTIGRPVIGMAVEPHIMYEEYSYQQICEMVETCVHNIRTNDLDSSLVKASVEMICSAMETYLSIWDCSISREANRLPRHFESLLCDLSKLSTEIKTAFVPIIKRLRKCAKLQSKAEQNVKTFNKQIEALDREYKKDKGLYSAFEEKFRGKRTMMTKRLTAIHQWLTNLTKENECSIEDDYLKFVHLMYCNGYRAKDLYVIITHILVMRHLSVMLYGVPANIKIEHLVAKHDNNFYGNVEIKEMVNG